MIISSPSILIQPGDLDTRQTLPEDSCGQERRSRPVIFDENGFHPDVLTGLAEDAAGQILQSYARHLEKGYRSSDVLSPSHYWARIFAPLAEALSDRAGGRETTASPEETALILVRNGLPRESVRALHKSVTISLQNGRYRIYRKPSGNKPGSFCVLDPGPSRPICSGFSSEELAGFLLSLDQAIPSLRHIYDKLSGNVEALRLQRVAHEKAETILKKTIDTLVQTYLLPIGIDCTYTVKDGTIDLSLSKTLSARYQIPITQLSEFLADADEVLATLTELP